MAEVAITGPLTIAGREFGSRLILGTGGFPRLETLADAIRVSGTELVTVALRRIEASARGSLVDVLDDCGVQLLPNTAGCFTARDAVLTAKLAREAFETDWVKLEVIGDERTLLPDVAELVLARPSSWSPTASSCCPTRPTIRCWRVAWRTSAAPRSCRSARRSAAGWGSTTPTTCA